MHRRTLLRGVVGGLGAAMIPRADASTFDLAAEVIRIDAMKAAYRLGTPGTMFDLEDHMYRLHGFFQTARTESDRARVGQVYTDAAQFVGHIKYNAVRYGAALWWIGHAHDIAEQTGDRAMVAVAFARRSIVRAAQGNTNQAIVLAGIGKRLDAGPWAEGFAETHLAYAHAKEANPYQALSAMDRAEAAFERAQADDTPPPFDTAADRIAQLDYHRGKLLVGMDPKRAEPYLVSVLNGLPPERRLRRSGIQIRRADIAASLDQFEQAVMLAKEGLTVAAEGGVTRDVNRVIRLRDKLGKVAPSRLVSELEEALAPHREVKGSVLWRNSKR